MPRIVFAVTMLSALSGCFRGRLQFDFAACESGDKPDKYGRCETAAPAVEVSKSAVTAAKLSTANCVNPDLNELAKGELITLCDGTLGEGKLVDCTSDGEQNCINAGAYKAANATMLSAAEIAYGTTVAGITGSKRDVRQCREATNLATYDASYPPSNLPLTFPAANMNSGSSDTIDLGGVHGLSTDVPVKFTTNNLPPELTMGTTYYAIVTSATSIRLAATPGGAYINFSSDGSGNHTIQEVGDGVVAYYDTLLKKNSGSAPWSTDYMCDVTNFKDVSSEVVPTGTIPTNGNVAFSSVWRDEMTGLLFTNRLYDAAGSTTWSDAVKLCESLNGTSAGSDWRLPTLKESLQLYVNGASDVTANGWSSLGYAWTATTDSSTPAWAFTAGMGDTWTYYRYLANQTVFCVK